MSKINSLQWKTLLQQSVDSHKGEKGEKSGREYIIAQDGRLSTQTLQNKDAPRLSITQITEISKNAFTELAQELKTPLTQEKAHEYKQLVKDIHDLTQQLITFREEKRAQTRVLRTIVLVISVLASLVLIGIPFFILIRNKDIKFANDINNLSNEVRNTAIASQTEINQQKTAADTQLLKKYGFEEGEITSILKLEEVMTPLMDQFHLLENKPSLTRNERDELQFTFPKKLKDLKLLIDHDVDSSLALKLIEMKGDFILLIKRLGALNEQLKNEKDEKLKKSFKEQIGNLVKEIKIKFQLTRIPHLINQVKEITDEMRQKDIQGHFDQEISTSPNSSGNLYSFVGDYERSEAFKRKDVKLSIEDKNPQPPYKKKIDSKGLTNEELLIQQKENEKEKAARATSGAALLDELLQYEEGDPTWKYILQTAAGQFNHYRGHGDIKGKFLIDSVENKCQWNDPIENKLVTLAMDYTGTERPSIQMEIIRDPISNKIQRVNIEVEGTMDIVGGDKIEVPEAIHGSLKYSITLNENKHPVISDVVTKIETKGVPKT